MTDTEALQIVDGPDKPGMQFALAYPDQKDVAFEVAGDTVHARLVEMREIGSGGFDFKLGGVVASGTHKGRRFEASYSVETRSGTLRVM